MSMEYESRYELEKQRRRELYLQRIRENTALYLEKYTKIYNEYLAHGYQDILNEEMKNLKEELNEAKQSLNVNPEIARDISLNIKKYIYALRGFYKNTIKEQKEILKIRREREILQKEVRKNEKLKRVNQEIKGIKNPIQREIAYKFFIELKNSIYNDSDINITKEIEKIKKISLEKAEEYQQENKQEEIQLDVERVKSAPIEILKEIEQSLKNDDIKKTKKLVDKAEKKILDERIRKETVKSLYKILKKNGFLVEKPKIINGEVIIKAKKPSGNRAYCQIKLDGKFSYKFDNYKGQACKEDIDKFKQGLNKIYGIKIKEEKITWQNPDMLYKDGIKTVSKDEKYL